MHRPRTDFEVERPVDHAAALGPEILQSQNEILEGQTRHSSDYSSRIARRASRVAILDSRRATREARCAFYPCVPVAVVSVFGGGGGGCGGAFVSVGGGLSTLDDIDVLVVVGV